MFLIAYSLYIAATRFVYAPWIAQQQEVPSKPSDVVTGRLPKWLDCAYTPVSGTKVYHVSENPCWMSHAGVGCREIAGETGR